jgi:hypothetical protein
LREGKLSRLVFIPVLVQNEQNPDAGINGEFVYQRKAAKDTWIDVRSIPLNSLKSGEGYTLSLKSAELLKPLGLDFKKLPQYWDAISPQIHIHSTKCSCTARSKHAGFYKRGLPVLAQRWVYKHFVNEVFFRTFERQARSSNNLWTLSSRTISLR